MLYRFQIDKWEQSSRVDNRNGDTIDFVDNRTFSQEEVYEFMHRAYERGRTDGRIEKAEDVSKILKL